MGRFYEALRRAAESNGTVGAANGKQKNDAKPPTATAGRDDEEETLVVSRPAEANGKRRRHPAGAAGREGAAAPEHLLKPSPYFNAPSAAHVSASTERTSEERAGSALPGARASRDAGATLGAAGSARAAEFSSREVSAARVEPHLVAVTEPRSPHTERYRSLRTRVLHAGERRQMRALVVTSAGVMEGKTLTAINLSWLLAQTDGVRALLIDGDLRHPCVADYLGLDDSAGLSEVLAGEAALEESIIRLEPSGLHLLPGGAARENVAELLSGPRFSAVLREARRLFDFVVIDAPPLGIFTDAAVLIDRADAALIVARAGRTRYAALEQLLEPLPRERLLGVVLNGADEEFDPKGYYYQRRYYGGAQRDGGRAAADDEGGAAES